MFLKHLNEKQPLKRDNNFLLHQDNAHPHVSKTAMDFIAMKGIKLLNHGLYSPDLALCSFYLFPELKRHQPDPDHCHKGVHKTDVKEWLSVHHGEVAQL